MISIKPGVSLVGIKPELCVAMMVAASVYQKYGFDFTVTSVTEGKHGRGSLHYPGLAFDSRMRNVPDHSQRLAIRDAIRDALGPQFDVVLEATPHLHIEFQPK